MMRSDVPPATTAPPEEGARATKGERTRARIMAAAEEVFGRRGYHDASIAEITRGAGVAQGSFYLYFPSKHAIFEELIRTRGDELRAALRAATSGLRSRAEISAAGFRAFFDWIREHPWLYRVSRQAEFIDDDLREHWYRTFAEEYAASLRAAMDAGEVAATDPDVLAWAVMGMADFTAMRWIVWQGGRSIPPATVEAFLTVATRALGIEPPAPAED